MENIVLFDGVCNFCNGAVNFIIRHDGDRRFRFAPLQSDLGQRMISEHKIPADTDSVILVEDGKAYLHSSAGLKIARGLGFPWSLGYAFIVIPAVIRDWAYKLFARYRYRLFGKQDMCMMPTPDV